MKNLFLPTMRRYLQGVVTHGGVVIGSRGIGSLAHCALKIALTATIAGAIFLSPIARAEEDESQGVQNEKNTNGFFPAETTWFNEGAAKTVFSQDPQKSESPEVGFYKEREERKEEEEDLFNHPQMLPADAINSKRPPFDTRKASKEQLVSFFGNPDEEAPLTPEDKAPMPFKGMMAAMDSGNDELAYKYARQYVRYVNNMTRRVKNIGQLKEVAIQREGIRKGSVENNPYKHLLDADLEEESVSPDEIDTALSGMDPEAASILKKARFDEEQGQQQVGAYQGPIDVMVFMNSGEHASLEVARGVELIKQQSVSDGKINFSGFVINNQSGNADYIRQKLGLTFDVQNGTNAARALNIRISPTVLIIARDTMQTIRLEDAASVEKIQGAITRLRRGNV